MGGHSKISFSSYEKPEPFVTPPDIFVFCPGVPDVGGNYYRCGTYEGLNVYRHTTGNFYIWYAGDGRHYITPVVGIARETYFRLVSSSPIGLYFSHGDYIGSCYAVMFGNLPPEPVLPTLSVDHVDGFWWVNIDFPFNMHSIVPLPSQVVISINDAPPVPIELIIYQPLTSFKCKLVTEIDPITSFTVFYTPSPISFVSFSAILYYKNFNVRIPPL